MDDAVVLVLEVTASGSRCASSPLGTRRLISVPEGLTATSPICRGRTFDV
jgi:hypothetical protein